MTGPGNGVSCGYGYLLGQRLFGVRNISANVGRSNVNVDPGIGPPIFALDDRRTALITNFRHQRQWNLDAGRCRDQYPFECFHIIPELTRVTQVDRVALQPFDGLGDVHAADGSLNDVLYRAHGKAVTGSVCTVDVKIEIVTTHRPVTIGRRRFRQRFHGLLNVL